MRRSLRYAILVGAVLITINHGEALRHGNIDAPRLFQMGLTVLVPYCVSTAAGIEAMQNQQRPAAPVVGQSRV